MKLQTHKRAEISLDALTFNLNSLKEFIKPETEIMGVVKADAYGHGAPTIGKYLLDHLGATQLAVAVIDEGIELREAGITAPILLLGPVTVDNIQPAIENDLTLTYFTKEHGEDISAVAKKLQKKAHVHLKMDSGMSRIGVRTVEEALQAINSLDSEWVNLEGIYTHFADADNLDNPESTREQYAKFEEIFTTLENDHSITFDLKHCCNTAATINFPEYHLDMVRLGIGMYGYWPDYSMKDLLPLKPIMRVISPITMVKEIEAGTKVGYGFSFEAEQSMKVVTVAIGYCDGVPRSLSNIGHFVLNGSVAPIVGRVCMDQIMIDASDLEVSLDEDEAVVFGDPVLGEPDLYEIADITNRFHYELLTNINKRVVRVYV